MLPGAWVHAAVMSTAQHCFSPTPAWQAHKELCCVLKKEKSISTKTAPWQQRTGQPGSTGNGEGQGSALPSMALSCSTQPEEQSKDGAQPSTLCSQLHTAGGSTATTSWCSSSSESFGPSLSWTGPAQQSQHRPAGSNTTQSPEGFVLMLFCSTAAASENYPPHCCLCELQHSHSSISCRFMRDVQMLSCFWTCWFWL